MQVRFLAALFAATILAACTAAPTQSDADASNPCGPGMAALLTEQQFQSTAELIGLSGDSLLQMLRAGGLQLSFRSGRTQQLVCGPQAVAERLRDTSNNPSAYVARIFFLEVVRKTSQRPTDHPGQASEGSSDRPVSELPCIVEPDHKAAFCAKHPKTATCGASEFEGGSREFTQHEPNDPETLFEREVRERCVAKHRGALVSTP